MSYMLRLIFLITCICLLENLPNLDDWNCINIVEKIEWMKLIM